MRLSHFQILHVFAVLVALINSSFAHVKCGTKSKSKEALDLMEGKINGVKRTRSGMACKKCITIDTYIYVFRQADGEGSVIDDAVIAGQMQILNKAFANSPFQFRVLETSFVVDDFFFSNFNTASELATEANLDHEPYPRALVKKWPRRGDYTTLNIYYGGFDSDYSFAFFPEPERKPWDAVYVMNNDLPLVYDANSLGKTTIHEVGHWLGLEHPFYTVTGKSCDPLDKNDYVLDTPQMANTDKGTDGECPSDSTDTCPLLPGNDPIHNFMDYSSDACQNQFTQGQIERMYYVWSIYRKGNEKCSTGYKLFEIEISSDSYPDETHWALQSTDGKFQWDTLEQNSHIYYEYPANSKTIQEICLDTTKEYTFTIFDDSKDGIESPGYYAIRYGGVQLKRNSAFAEKDATRFSGGSKPPPTLCFSGNSRVQVQNNGWIPLSSVKMGDKVLVSEGKYEEVYSFGHRNVVESAQFLQIFSDDTDHQPIEISTDHLILLRHEHWVPAGTVQVGDLLTKGDGTHVAVTRVRYVTRKGIFAPFTKSGTIVVNDIVASNYVTFQQGSEYLTIGGIETPLTFHWLAHTFESGHRLVCRFCAVCGNESYTGSGISHWVAMPREAGEMLLKQHPIVVAVFVFVLVIVFGMLSLVEEWIEIGVVTILIAIVLSRLFKVTSKRITI